MKEQTKLAREIMGALKDVDIPNNTDIYITVESERIIVKVTEHIYSI